MVLMLRSHSHAADVSVPQRTGPLAVGVESTILHADSPSPQPRGDRVFSLLSASRYDFIFSRSTVALTPARSGLQISPVGRPEALTPWKPVI